MPSGKTHDKITVLSAPLVTIGTYAVTQDVTATTIITGTFIFSGLMFSGDLDIKSRQYNRWGPLKCIWIPYQKIFSHRSIWTHGVGIGSIVRILYLLFWILAIGTIVTLLSGSSFNIVDYIHIAWNWINTHTYEVISIAIGLVLGEISHTGADLTVSWFKKKRKSLRLNSSRSTSRKRKVQRHIH